MKLVVSGLMNVESTLNVHVFPVGYAPLLYAFNDVDIAPSGVAFNVSCALKALGDEVIPVSIIGKDALGRMICGELADRGISSAHIDRSLERTCASAMMKDNNGRCKVYCDLKDVQDRLLDAPSVLAAAADADGFVLCNTNFNRSLLDGIRGLNIPVFTNVHSLHDVEDPYNSRFMEVADVVFLSADSIFGNHEDFLRRLYERYHSKVILLGQGAKGALLLDAAAGTIVSHPVVTTREIVSTYGGGDALFSAFTHFYLSGLSPVEALHKAMTFVSWTIGESGTTNGYPDAEKLAELCASAEYSVYPIAEL